MNFRKIKRAEVEKIVVVLRNYRVLFLWHTGTFFKQLDIKSGYKRIFSYICYSSFSLNEEKFIFRGINAPDC